MQEYPIIPAMHNSNDIDVAIKSKAKILFMMRGNIFELEKRIEELSDNGKMIFVHFDLIKGLSRDENGVNYYRTRTKTKGLITTNGNICKVAQSESIPSILRIFIVDSNAFENSIHTIHSVKPTFVEIMPALLPRVILELKERIEQPIIAGGDGGRH